MSAVAQDVPIDVVHQVLLEDLSSSDNRRKDGFTRINLIRLATRASHLTGLDCRPRDVKSSLRVLQARRKIETRDCCRFARVAT